MSQNNGAAKTFPSILDKLDGPQLAALKDAVFNAATTISRFALAGRSFDDRRDLKKECGYPDTVSAEEYQRLFDEEPYAARVVELWPKESWKTTPTVYEDEDAEEATEFEAAIDALGQALRTERSYHVEEEGSVLWDYLYRADVVSGIGCYGIILLGLNDGKALSEPAEPFADDPTAEGVVDRINFVRVFPEALASISALESDPRSPRYGQPVAYSVTFSDPSELATGGAVIGLGSTTSQVHWTRVIHVADVWHLASASDWFAKPRMKNPLHSLLDIQKIRGSSGEGFWRAVVNLLSLETHPQLGGDVDINRDQLRRELENFYNGMQRDLVTSGMSVKTLAPTVTDPNPFIEANVQSICVVMNVPVPVFKGYEIGEQASQNNDTTWLARVAARNEKYVTPRLIVPLVDRLVSLRVLPEPETGYKVAWPDNSTPKATETAAVAAQRVTAMATYVSGGVEALMAPMDFLTRELKYTEEEADEILEASAQAEEEKLAEQQALAEEQGFEMEAPEGMVDPAQREAEQEIAMEQAKAGAKAGPPGKKAGLPTANELVENAKLEGGRWVTTSDGNRIYIKDGEPIAGNPHVLAKAKSGVSRSSLENSALKAGKKLFGKSLEHDGVRGVVKQKLSKLSKEDRFVNDFEYVFHPSTGKGIDASGDEIGAHLADKDGKVYTYDATDSRIRVISIDKSTKKSNSSFSKGQKVIGVKGHEKRGEGTVTYSQGKNVTIKFKDGWIQRVPASKVLVDNSLDLAGKKGGPPPFVKNVYCPTGEGGGVDPTCSPKESGGGEGKGGLSEKRQRAIEEQASKIPVTKDNIFAESVSEDDYEAIEERMTRSEREAMEEHFEQIAREAAEESANNADLSPSREDVLDAAGLTEEDFENNPDGAQTKFEEVEQEMMISMRDEYIDDYVNDFSVSRGERREYLRQFYNDNSDDPRFAGSVDVLDKWGTSSSDGRDLMFFQTSAGDPYKISSGRGFRSGEIERATGLPTQSIEFSDPDGSYEVTGRGNAKEVFSKVTAATVAYIKANPDKAFYFTAGEPSRQSLYEKLVKTTAKVIPSLAAVAVDIETPSGAYTTFIVGPREKIHQGASTIVSEVGKYAPRGHRVIVNQDSTMRFLRPMIDPSWFPED